MVNAVLGLPVLVTGATGFIGSAVVASLRAGGAQVACFGRRIPSDLPGVVGDFFDVAAMQRALHGQQVVLHCAGFAHAFSTPDEEAAALHQNLNCDAVLSLARAAVAAGVRRFVLCSSVKAGGEPGAALRDEQFEGPLDGPYAVAKRAAEQGLAALAQETGLEVVCLRFSMVYGPGGRGNMARLLQAVGAGRFPPVPETGNRRSMVFISDAVSALCLAATHPAAQGAYIVAHPEAPSGAALYGVLRDVLGLPPAAWVLPAWVWRLAGGCGNVGERMLRRALPLNSQVVSRLLDSAHFSSSRLMQELGWQPRFACRDGLEAMRAVQR